VKPIRPTFAVLGVLLLPLVVASPASAAGQRCETGSSVTRCASVSGSGETLFAHARVDSLRTRVKVRVVSVALQRRTDTGWVVVSRTVPPDAGFFSGDSASAAAACGSAARGVYRSRGVVEWRVRGTSGTRTDAVASRGVRRGRLCG